MKNIKLGKKGVSTGMIVILLFVAVLFTGTIVYVATQAAVPSRVPVVVEYDGEFNDAGVPSEVSGTDTGEKTTYNETDNEFDITMNVTTNMNASMNAINGQIFYLATRIDINDDVENLEVDGTLDSSRTTDCETRRAYLLEDEKGISMDEDDAIYVFDVDSDMDDFDGDTGVLPKGDYVLVVEMKAVSISDSIAGNLLYTIEVELDTEEDVDKGKIYVYA